MKKHNTFWVLCAVGIILLLPWLAVTFAPGDAGMAICFILFYAVNPAFSIFEGVYAGKDIRQSWSLTVITPALFLIGTWIFFDMGEPAFILYSGVYLLIGVVAMLTSAFARKKALQ